MHWTYQGKTVENLPEDCEAFVYLITNTTNGMPIKHYEIKKSRKATDGTYQTFANAESLGKIQGTFFVSFEDASGEYRYFVRAIDVLGMRSGDANSTIDACLLYTSPSPRDLSTSRMPSAA